MNLHFDLSKAFDSICNDILLDKLRYYGVTDGSLQLLKSYLSDRKQYAQFDDVLSSMQYIKTVIPQGSIVGLLFFSIYINDIVKCPENIVVFCMQIIRHCIQLLIVLERKYML